MAPLGSVTVPEILAEVPASSLAAEEQRERKQKKAQTFG